jgi:hypothetical protein
MTYNNGEEEPYVSRKGTVFNINSCKLPLKEYKIMYMKKMGRRKMLVKDKET